MVEAVKLPEEGEDVGVSVDGAEPAALQWELRLTQAAQEAVLSQDRAAVRLLGLKRNSATLINYRVSLSSDKWTYFPAKCICSFMLW